jgi:hypothetical protein
MIHLEEHWLFLITWISIVTSPTYSFANDKFIKSQEIIVIKIEESLNFVVKIKLYYVVCSSTITDSDYRLGVFKLFRGLLSVNCSKSGYKCI